MQHAHLHRMKCEHTIGSEAGTTHLNAATDQWSALPRQRVKDEGNSRLREPLDILVLMVLLGSTPGCAGLIQRVPSTEEAFRQGWFNEWEWLAGEPPTSPNSESADSVAELVDGVLEEGEVDENMGDSPLNQAEAALQARRTDAEQRRLNERARRLPEEPPLAPSLASEVSLWSESRVNGEVDRWGNRPRYQLLNDEIIYRQMPTSLSLHLGDAAGFGTSP